MKSGFAVMSEAQFLPGYCLLLASPKVANLNSLVAADRAQFLADMAELGDAVLAVTGAVRINYSIYGNLDPFLHAHLFPRYADEDEAQRTLPPFLIPEAVRSGTPYDPEIHDEIRDQIRARLEG
ncbi:hypothetical protein BH11ARM1_BH11ARM1_16780 [soil metagenome]